MFLKSVTAAAPSRAAPLRCFIVDEDLPAAEALAACVQRVPWLVLAGTCTTPEQALGFLQQQPIDVLFLPLELPLLAGLALLRAQGSSPAVVLISSYPDYNSPDYGYYGVVDYLLKPISFLRFLQVAVRLATERTALSLPVSVTTPRPFPQADGLYFWLGKQLVQVRLTEVLYVEDLPGHTRVCTVHQEFLTEQAFSAVAAQLPEPQFLLVNASFVVALRHATPVGTTLLIGNQRVLVEPALQEEILARAFQTSW